MNKNTHLIDLNTLKEIKVKELNKFIGLLLGETHQPPFIVGTINKIIKDIYTINHTIKSLS